MLNMPILGGVMGSHTVFTIPAPAPAFSLKRECASCPHIKESPWCHLDDQEISRITRIKKCQPYLTGQLLFEQGMPCKGIFCVVSGIVAVRQSAADGSSVIIRIAGEGDLLGYRTFFSGEDYPDSAEALSPSMVCFIPCQTLSEIIKETPEVARHFLRRLAADQGAIQEKFLQTSNCSVRDRLLGLLATFKNSYGSPIAGGELEIRLPLTRKDLAAMIGTCTESVIRAMRALEKDGVARFSGRMVVVAKPDLLCDDLL